MNLIIAISCSFPAGLIIGFVLAKFLVRCKHEWKIIGRGELTEFCPFMGKYIKGAGEYYKYQCAKCNKIKVNKFT